MYFDEFAEVANRELVGKEGEIVKNNDRQQLGVLKGVEWKKGKVSFIFSEKIIYFHPGLSWLFLAEENDAIKEHFEDLFIGGKNLQELFEEADEIVKTGGATRNIARERRDARIKEIKDDLSSKLMIEEIIEDGESEEAYILSGINFLEKMLKKALNSWEVKKFVKRVGYDSLMIESFESGLIPGIKDLSHYFGRLISDFENLQEKVIKVYENRAKKTEGQSLKNFLDKENVNPKRGDYLFIKLKKTLNVGTGIWAEKINCFSIILKTVDLNRNKIYGNEAKGCEEGYTRGKDIVIDFNDVEKCEWGRLTPWCY